MKFSDVTHNFTSFLNCASNLENRVSEIKGSTVHIHNIYIYTYNI